MFLCIWQFHIHMYTLVIFTPITLNHSARPLLPRSPPPRLSCLCPFWGPTGLSLIMVACVSRARSGSTTKENKFNSIPSCFWSFLPAMVLPRGWSSVSIWKQHILLRACLSFSPFLTHLHCLTMIDLAWFSLCPPCWRLLHLRVDVGQ